MQKTIKKTVTETIDVCDSCGEKSANGNGFSWFGDDREIALHQDCANKLIIKALSK